MSETIEITDVAGSTSIDLTDVVGSDLLGLTDVMDSTTVEIADYRIDWILTGGFWNDTGIWVDAEYWYDEDGDAPGGETVDITDVMGSSIINITED